MLKKVAVSRVAIFSNEVLRQMHFLEITKYAA